MFYVVTEHAPRVNEGRLPVMFKVPVGRDEVYVCHSDYLPQLRAYAWRLGYSLLFYGLPARSAR
jgi:hypothetical protein